VEPELPDGDEREVGTVLCTLMWRPEDVQPLRDAFAPAEFVHLHPGDEAGIADVLQRAEVAIHQLDIDERFLRAPRLRWVHCDHSGLTRSAKPEVFERGLIVTGSAGRSATALAQHAFYFALALTFDARRLFQMQDAHIWRGIPDYHERLALAGKTLGVIGFGHTGKAMADLGAAFGMRVIAYRRRAGETDESVDQMLSADAGDTVDDLLEQADVVMLAAQLSDETRHMISAREFALMKRDAYIINLARGPLINQADLIAALESGQIAGAGLDVTDPEPLPSDSALWDMPNVVITPHVTPKLPDRTGRSAQIIIENLARYRSGQPLRNALTPRDIYTHD